MSSSGHIWSFLASLARKFQTKNVIRKPGALADAGKWDRCGTVCGVRCPNLDADMIRVAEEIGRVPFVKRSLAFAILITVFVSALVIFLVKSLMTDPKAPRFIPNSGDISPGNYSFLQYEFLSPSPFEGGKMWVSVFSTNRVHTFLLDIESNSILGELVNASPAFFNRDQTKVLCSQRMPVTTNALWRTIKDLPARVFNRPSHAFEESETFWVIDLRPSGSGCRCMSQRAT